MANQAIALQARAPRIPTYNELVAGRDQARSRQNTMAMQEQGMQQAANAQAEAAQQKAAMRQALMMAGSGDIAGAEKQFGLGAGNLEVQTALSGVKKDRASQERAKLEAAGVAAYAALRIPDPEQRKALFQQASPMLQAAGWTPEQIAQFPVDDESLDGAILNGLKPEEALKSYTKSQEGYTLTPGSKRFVGDKEIASVAPTEGITYVQTPEGLMPLPKTVSGGGGGAGLVGGPRGNAGGGAVADALQTNPGALKDGPFARSQPGYAGASGGFATFKTPQAGIAAQESLLRGSYVNKGFNTVNKIIDKYAPQGRENSGASVANYKKYVAQQAGIDINAPISPSQIPAVAKAMREFETGQTQGRGGGVNMGQVIPGTAKPAPAAKGVKPVDAARAYTAMEGTAAKYDKTIALAEKLLNSRSLDSIVGNVQGNLPEVVLGLSSQDAADALSDYNALIAVAGFQELQAMRDASPTGGALGQVSDKENKFLQQSAFASSRTQSEAKFRESLRNYIKLLRESKGRVLGAYERTFGSRFTPSAAAAPQPARRAAPAAGGSGKVLKYNPATGDFE